MILIDLKKSFDTIDRKILIEKNELPCKRWKGFSSPGKLAYGVLQGFIFSPLLFLLYVNEMPQAVN